MKNGGFTALIMAAGSATRMGGIDKVFLEICGKSVLAKSMLAFQQNENVEKIIVVTKKGLFARVVKEAKANNITKFALCLEGGDTRAQSVYNGLKQVKTPNVLVHDCARPLVTQDTINNVVGAVLSHGAAVCAVPLKDTVKQVDVNGAVVATPDRSYLVAVQTPQGFETKMLLEAYSKFGDLSRFTDDAAVAEAAGNKVYTVTGDNTNIKITTPEDVKTAAGYLGGNGMRIGHGYDVHKFAENRKLVLGGVVIPNEQGLLGHSDADVVLHAVCDALLGAAALGDIGKHFPDTDPKYKGIDSKKLLSGVIKLVYEKGYTPKNIDVTIVAQVPRLSPYIEAMRTNIAACCNMDSAYVSVKATTEEGLGFTGQKLGIAVHAVCIIE